jgi:selenophosphate synthetase-related protein
MADLVSLDPHEESRRKVIEMLEGQLEEARSGGIISISIVTVQPDSLTTKHMATQGNQTLMMGALFTQLYKLATLGWEDA